tara:strand:+ start:655 stop:804 length:150 start_codon:yes stop_codon:yes gene_type:complete
MTIKNKLKDQAIYPEPKKGDILDKDLHHWTEGKTYEYDGSNWVEKVENA